MEVPVADVAYAFQPVVDLYKTKVNLCRSWRVYWFSIEIEPVPSVDGLIDELRKQIDTHWIVRFDSRIQFTDKSEYDYPRMVPNPCNCLEIYPPRFEHLLEKPNSAFQNHANLIAEMNREKHDI